MDERTEIRHGLKKVEAQCGDNLPWQPLQLQNLEVGENLFIREITLEKCSGCGIKREAALKPRKWVWHRTDCENPGDIEFCGSSHIIDPEITKKDRFRHIEQARLFCRDCQAVVTAREFIDNCDCPTFS